MKNKEMNKMVCDKPPSQRGLYELILNLHDPSTDKTHT